MSKLVVIAVVLSTRLAHAGICEAERVIGQIESEEQRAKQAKISAGALDTQNVCFSEGDASPWIETGKARPALIERLVKACTVILDKRPDDRDCMVEVAYFHRDRAGGHDVVAGLVATRPNQIADRRAPEALGMTRAARAEPVLIARWQELQAIADKQPGNADLQGDWAAWRSNAAVALGAVGGADAKAFLAAQVAQKIDRGVKKRAAEAIAAIDQRLAAPAK